MTMGGTVGAADAADAPARADALQASPEWQAIDFISDLHLAEDTPHGFEAWAAYMQQSSADAIFILGDLFEAWPGDDARFEGFEARCAAVLREASARRFVAFLVGNRDFLVGDQLLTDCGVHSLADPTVLEAFGSRVLLSHGDAWCIADTEYQRFRRQVRNPAWKGAVLAQTLEQRRALARHLREQSEQQSQVRTPDDWADVDAPVAVEWMAANKTPLLIHGHTHRPGLGSLAPGFTRQVLSDWDLDHGSAGRAEVLRWQSDGFTRLSPGTAATATSSSPPGRA